MLLSVCSASQQHLVPSPTACWDAPKPIWLNDSGQMILVNIEGFRWAEVLKGALQPILVPSQTTPPSTPSLVLPPSLSEVLSASHVNRCLGETTGPAGGSE